MISHRIFRPFNHPTLHKAKHICVISLFVLFQFFGCADSGSETRKNNQILKKSSRPKEALLNKYRAQTSFTDPGEHAYLFDKLPDSNKALCNIIKKQLIHPMEAAGLTEVFPKDKLPEDGEFPTISDILQELVIRDPDGLTLERKPADRILVACYHHGLFLASILRYQREPVRLRAGFARYYEEQLNLRFSHVICEVWNSKTDQWDKVDPDRNIYSVSKGEFEYSSVAWQNNMNKNLPKAKYIGSLGQGEALFIHSLLLDMAFVLCNERSYWHTPSFIFEKDFTIDSLDAEQIQVLNLIAELMNAPDQNIAQLEKLYKENAFIQSHERSIDEYYQQN